MSFIELTVQATITMIVLVDPFLRGVFFRILTEHEPDRRVEYVRRIMITVAVLLGGAALVGKPFFDLIGIHLGAFGIVGGIVLALMGFEMLYQGDPSKTQGGKKAHEEPQPISAEQSIIVPYAMPFMAGPGAITSIITISVSGDGYEGTFAALIAVAVTVALIPVGHILLLDRMKFSTQSMGLITRFGGLFIATIGVQLVLGGIKSYFGL
ncbi:MAG: MarC family protein [Gammaproteobacteria bacterium]|jgi:multiple antibiotic resistance protein|nr:MarC family protein [Gammaproteobacteria bacterium]